jgi:hypothetical protein
MITLLAIGVGLISSPLKLTTDSQRAPDALAKTIRDVMEEQVCHINDGETGLMTVYFRKTISARATAEQIKNGLTYREIPETTLIGAVKLHKAFVDYRKQEIPVGVYTLRLVFQPDTGDHTGTAPHTEFLLLCPASADKSPDETDVKTVVDMSKKATGGDHPGVLLLVPDQGDKAKPALTERDSTAVLHVRRALDVNGKESSLGFGIVVKGISKTR